MTQIGFGRMFYILGYLVVGTIVSVINIVLMIGYYKYK